jgi:hypothetical protein
MQEEIERLKQIIAHQNSIDRSGYGDVIERLIEVETVVLQEVPVEKVVEVETILLHETPAEQIVKEKVVEKVIHVEHIVTRDFPVEKIVEVEKVVFGDVHIARKKEVPESVNLTLDFDYPMIMKQGSAKFIGELKRDLANALHVPSERIDVTNLSPGSVKATITFYDSGSGPTPLMLIRELHMQIMDTSSTLMRGKITSKIQKIQGIVRAESLVASSSRHSEVDETFAEELDSILTMHKVSTNDQPQVDHSRIFPAHNLMDDRFHDRSRYFLFLINRTRKICYLEGAVQVIIQLSSTKPCYA